jgi:hypothetical protein
MSATTTTAPATAAPAAIPKAEFDWKPLAAAWVRRCSPRCR